jgi:hypothetical protein
MSHVRGCYGGLHRKRHMKVALMHRQTSDAGSAAVKRFTSGSLRPPTALASCRDAGAVAAATMTTLFSSTVSKA